jgi:CHRD domain-containing protein
VRTAIAMTATALLLIAGAASAQTYSAILTGTQETPPNASPAAGTGSFTLDGAKMLSFNISYSGLTGTETAAHIHCCAAPGTPAGVLFPLPAGNPKVGSVGPLTAQQEADLNAGLMYVNIHTSPNFSGGEIRGQIYNTVATASKTWSAVKQLFKQ